jgi:hypothetical protein
MFHLQAIKLAVDELRFYLPKLTPCVKTVNWGVPLITMDGEKKKVAFQDLSLAMH